jgi:hypothetical protein
MTTLREAFHFQSIRERLDMPFQRGKAKTGGRRKGVANKGTAARQQVKEEARLLRMRAELASREEIELAIARVPTMGPLDVMLMGMHLKLARGDLDGAMQIATAAAPYTSPRLNATDVNVKHSLANRSDAEVSAEIEALRAKIGHAQLPTAVTAPPLIEATAESVPEHQKATAPE